MTKVLVRALTPLSAAGLEQMIRAESDFVLVREGNGGADEEADVIVSEVGPAEGHSPEGPREISDGGAAVVLLLEDPPPGWAGGVMAGSVKALLPRRIAQEELAAAVRAAAAGLFVIHPDNAEGYFPERRPEERGEFPLEPLTPRERDVLRKMADGLSNKEIAASLGISEHTVKFHVAAILGKLGAAGRTEAVMTAVRRGLVMV
jgi:DNA-binding NarL/FixJ family response regulator